MKNNDFKNIIKSSFYLYLIQGLNYLLPLITLPYLLVILSSEDFAKYTFSFATSQFFVLLVDFGFNLSATKKIAENSESEQVVKDIFINTIFIKCLLFLFSVLLAIVLIFLFKKIYYYRTGILISLIMVLGTALFPIWWFQGMNKMKTLSIINVISKVITYPFIFVFVKHTKDSNTAIFLQSLNFLVAGIISIGYIYKTHYFYFKEIALISIRSFRNEMKDSWSIFLSNSSISLYTNSLTILLGLFSSTYDVGLFGAMERIVRVVCFGILGPVNQACFPIVAKLKVSDFARAKKIFKVVLFSVLILMIVSYILSIIFQKIVIDKFLAGYRDVNQLLLIFMFMIFPISLGGILGQLGLLGLGGEKQKKTFSKVYTIVGILSLPISFLCIYYFHIYGAIYSMMTVECIIFILMAYFVKKYRYF